MAKVFVLLIWLPGLAGCGAPSGGSGPATARLVDLSQVPVGAGPVLFSLGTFTTKPLELQREKILFSLRLPRGFPFYKDDLIRNTSGREISLDEIASQARFILNPDAAVTLHPNGLTLSLGSGRFTFFRVEGRYQIRIPYATIGIRGTSLAIDVGGDQSSRISVAEGTVEVEGTRGTVVLLKAGETLSIDHKGTIGRPEMGSPLVPSTIRPVGQ